ncbi:hypothetical protein LTR56_021523 [Elasticomyces elasticus]|nr:hypothetical protein LTR56_021523 [Elasticomyces elasticus]KAK3631262.1 hypothetical protein LTR22_021146 [Elasticomyces elasticus]KAK4909357.1 hypothetical protein LTR49_021869 [Elasticomyces elasticus]KAK5749385.1 hypothetical protein LTS12_020566 [Elasticomyces elasticus]
MDALLSAHETLESKANLSATLTSVDDLISLLQSTRDNLNSEKPQPKLIKPLKSAFSSIEDSLKEVNKGLNTYQKALKDKFKKDVVGLYPAADTDDASERPLVGAGLAEAEGKKGLVERALAMHLLREGHFDVARTFVREVGDGVGGGGEEGGYEWLSDFVDQEEDSLMGGEEEEQSEDDDEDLYGGSVVVQSHKGHLQRKFAEMYRILSALRENHDLEPAIRWAQRHGAELGQRASNLEFELARLRFVELYTSASSDMQHQESAFTGPILALEYARTTHPTPTSSHNPLGTPSPPSSPRATHLY